MCLSMQMNFAKEKRPRHSTHTVTGPTTFDSTCERYPTYDSSFCTLFFAIKLQCYARLTRKQWQRAP